MKSRYLLGLLLSTALGGGCSQGLVSDPGSTASEALGAPVTVSFQNGVAPAESFTGTEDTYLEEATPSVIHGNDAAAAVDANWGGKRAVSLLRFSLSSIPPGSKVTAVKLTLNVTNNTNSTGFGIYEMLRTWAEYQATWTGPTGDSKWTSGGAASSEDHTLTSMGTVNPTAIGLDTTTLNATGLAVVQKWVNAPSTNFGVIIPPGGNTDAAVFTTTESRTPTLRPKLTVTYQPAAGKGSGLMAEYFANPTLSGSPSLTRHDAQIDFTWEKDSPGAPIPVDGWSARWTGTVVPTHSETYTFTTVSDDGIRLWVNGRELIDDWASGPANSKSGTIALTAGQHYDLKVEYWDKTSTATAQLFWASKSQPKQLVPSTALYPATPRGEGGTPIKYIVVMVKENHTFDNYFTDFPGAASSRTARLSTGTVITRPIAPTSTMNRDLSHVHTSAVRAFTEGLDQVGGTVKDASGHTDYLAYSYHPESQIPNYWQYARNFVLADHFFSTTFANSYAGHFATTTGFNRAIQNPSGGCACGDNSCTIQALSSTTGCYTVQTAPCWDEPSIVTELPAGYTWSEYGVPTLKALKRIGLDSRQNANFKPISAILSDIQSGHQPNLMFAHVNSGSASEHPPEAVCPGENYSVQVINAIMNGPHWKETAILLLWDDWGGFYDSVRPPSTKCSSGDYARPGFRLPLMVISPYARKGVVLHTPSEQASVIKLVEDLWGMNRLQGSHASVLDDTSGSLLGAFDFTQTPRSPLLLNPRVCP